MEFKIKQGSFEILKKENKKHCIRVVVAFMLIEIITYIIISILNVPKEPGFLKMTITLTLALISFFCVNAWQIKLIKIIFNSYRLLLSGNLIKREQENSQAMLIYCSDIEKITKDKTGAFIITGKNKHYIIHVSKYIENHAQLEELLNKIKPITKI